MSRLTAGHMSEGTQGSVLLFGAFLYGIEVKKVQATKDYSLGTSLFWLIDWVMHSFLHCISPSP